MSRALRILLVEDDMEGVFLVQKLLARTGNPEAVCDRFRIDPRSARRACVE